MLSQVAAGLAERPKHADRERGAEIALEWDAFVEDVATNGVLDPLHVTPDPDVEGAYLVIDGRHRLNGAQQANLKTVPCIIHQETEAPALMASTVTARRHWTKGQRAYFLVTLHPRVALTKPGRPSKAEKYYSVVFSSASKLAEAHGLSQQLVAQAVQLYRIFHAPSAKAGSTEAIEAEATRDKYELSIWAGASLGAVLAGIGGGDGTRGKRPSIGFQGLDKPLGTLARMGKAWGDWDEAERDKAAQLIAAKAKDLPADFRASLVEALASVDA